MRQKASETTPQESNIPQNEATITKPIQPAIETPQNEATIEPQPQETQPKPSETLDNTTPNREL